MLGFRTKALKSSHVQTLGATSACDPAVCGFLNRLQISTQHFNITASSAKLRETRDSNIFSLWFFFFFFETANHISTKKLEMAESHSKAKLPKNSTCQTAAPRYTKHLASCSLTNKFLILTQKKKKKPQNR